MIEDSANQTKDLDLPPRMLSADEHPKGSRVNVYQSMKIIHKLSQALTEEELQFLRDSSFKSILDITSKLAWSGSFGLLLLSRQLEVKKENEIWIIFAGCPIRFSLREFKIVTGLPCGKYPPTHKKKKKNKCPDGKEVSFFETLFGGYDDITIERAISMLNPVLS